MKLPAIQFYTADWLKDIAVQSLSYEYRGIWFQCLCYMNESEQRGKLILNGLAMKHDEIANLLGLDNQKFEAWLTTVLTKGVADIEPDTGALINKRMVRDEILRKIKQENGKKGGNPRLLNQESNQHANQQVNQCANLKGGSSSSTSSSTSSLKENIRCAAGGAELPFGSVEFRTVWEEYCLHRTQKKAKLTPIAQKRLLNRLTEWGEERAIAAIKFSIAQGWDGVYEERASQSAKPTKPSTHGTEQIKPKLFNPNPLDGVL